MFLSSPLESEVTLETEWTLYDDANVDSMGQWFHVVKHCVENRIFPTILYFEKLDPQDQIKRSNKFIFTEA